MKRFLFLSLFIILLIMLVACSPKSIDKVIIYEMENFSVVKEETAIGLTTKKEIEVFQNAFSSAVKQSGVVDMVDPNFKVDLGEETYFLWISEGSGTVMNTKDTHTIYSLSKKSATEVYETVMINYVN
ncbi:hypothetical protein RJD24_10270 [Bacillaceae bacterium IKA-2]|nr:hypothetical protein RJD24_10270 [Bacillaceae bacterium IKA-2]